MQIGTMIRPARPLPNFSVSAPIIDKRMGKWGWEFAVINGGPNNESKRWYALRDVRLAKPGPIMWAHIAPLLTI